MFSILCIKINFKLKPKLKSNKGVKFLNIDYFSNNVKYYN